MADIQFTKRNDKGVMRMFIVTLYNIKLTYFHYLISLLNLDVS